MFILVLFFPDLQISFNSEVWDCISKIGETNYYTAGEYVDNQVEYFESCGISCGAGKKGVDRIHNIRSFKSIIGKNLISVPDRKGNVEKEFTSC